MLSLHLEQRIQASMTSPLHIYIYPSISTKNKFNKYTTDLKHVSCFNGILFARCNMGLESLGNKLYNSCK